MIFRRRAILALLTALFALALPGVASADAIVDSVADEPDAVAGGACETAAGKCTLRAAIEVTNLAGTAQDILFESDPFNGQLADTIEPLSPLPAIQAPVSLNAGSCQLGSIPKPCAGVSGPAGNPGISVEADGVTIANLSVTGARAGIDVIGESQDFTALGNWIGVKLDGSAGPNQTGIFIGPGSDGATIGGSNPGERNVIAGNDGEGIKNEGLDIEGASDAVIRGNYFGVAGDGTTRMENGTNIEVTDSTTGGGFAAEDNEIGATIEGAPLISEACDGGCNVISGARKGVVLSGFESSEAPASGPTTVHGNYIGLNAAGSGAIVNSEDGIGASEADHVTVGGLARGAKNYFAGGGIGIVGDGEQLRVLGNSIGIAPDGSDLPAPSEAGVFAAASGVSEEPSIEGNEIRMDGGVGIDAWFATGRVVGNRLEGGSSGIYTFAGPGGGLIAGNEIESPTDNGILVENPDNEVRANTIVDSAGVGIRVTNPPGIAMNGGLIGGDTAEKENVIEGSKGAPIEILEEATEPGSTTEIARNRGGDNGGLFIDLVAGANEGILPPTFSAAIQSKAEGTAEPGARVRVFRKASAEPGELQSFLAAGVADGSGNWSVTYPQIPTGTIVAATQTNVDGATSELKTSATSADPSPGGGGSGGGTEGDKKEKGKPKGKEKGKGKDKTAPQTTIIEKKIKGRVAKFRFVSSEAGSAFQCKLDRRKFKPCLSPTKYKRLKPGIHIFEVRAIDPAGNRDKTPATRRFRVLPRR
jgi:Right handed beta helix region